MRRKTKRRVTFKKIQTESKNTNYKNQNFKTTVKSGVRFLATTWVSPYCTVLKMVIQPRSAAIVLQPLGASEGQHQAQITSTVALITVHQCTPHGKLAATPTQYLLCSPELAACDSALFLVFLPVYYNPVKKESEEPGRCYDLIQIYPLTSHQSTHKHSWGQ